MIRIRCWVFIIKRFIILNFLTCSFLKLPWMTRFLFRDPSFLEIKLLPQLFLLLIIHHFSISLIQNSIIQSICFSFKMLIMFLLQIRLFLMYPIPLYFLKMFWIVIFLQILLLLAPILFFLFYISIWLLIYSFRVILFPKISLLQLLMLIWIIFLFSTIFTI